MEKVFITGGSGTVGVSFISYNLDKFKIYSYSRNEKAQVALKRRFPKVNIILGSIEDKYNLENSIRSINPDILIHAAALKHVDTAEKQPIEMVKSNIIGSKNIIESAINNKIPITIGISTDKACNPKNLYGYSKRIMERMFLEANSSDNIFLCTRFGNVAGSNGSVIPFWINQKKRNLPLSLTDVNMNRLMLDNRDVSSIIEKCINEGRKKKGGFIISKKMKNVVLLDLAKIISDKIELVGLREGEELNENLISEDELKYTQVNEEYIYIHKEVVSNTKLRLKTPLSSDNGVNMNKEELTALVLNVKELLNQEFLY